MTGNENGVASRLFLHHNTLIRISADELNAMKGHVMNTEAKVHEATIQVRVITTAGSYPEHGHQKVPADEPIQSILDRAATQLKIVDVAGWFAKINDTEVDPARSYASYGFHGEVKIDFGKREGGGGYASALV
jgi:hypothetical protein